MIFMTVYGGARADTCKEMPERCPAALVGDDVVWLKGNACEKTAPTHSQGTHQPDFSHGAPAPSFRVMGADMHGTIRPQQKIDTAFLVTYLIVIATAAIVIWIHPKPELIPLVLWHAGHPL
jgi:hypothetical protein